MKFSCRLLLLLCCFIVLLSPFSTLASASNDFDLSSLNWRIAIADTNYNYVNISDNVRPLTHLWRQSGVGRGSGYPQYLMFEYTSNSEGFNLATSTIIVNKGDGFSVHLDNFQDVFKWYDSNNNVISTRVRKAFNPTITVELFDVSGNFVSVVPTNVQTSLSNDSRISFSLDVETVPIDVYRFRVVCYESSKEEAWDTSNVIPDVERTWSREFLFDSYSSHSIKSIPEEKGLLKSIISWLQSIGNSIAELPSKIWNLISEGLKSLFVPDAEYMQSYKDKWDSLLSARLGAVYQVGGFVGDFFETVFSNPDAIQRVIPFKSVTISLPGGATFSFPSKSGGTYRVQAVPVGMESVADTLKVITGIVGTFLFCNGLLKRYEEVMGVEK